MQYVFVVYLLLCGFAVPSYCIYHILKNLKERGRANAQGKIQEYE